MSWAGPRRAVRQLRAGGARRPELRRDVAASGRAIARARPLIATVGIVQWSGELERRIAGLLDEGRSTMTKNNRWLVCLVALLFVAGGIDRFGDALERERPQIKVTGLQEPAKARTAKAAAGTNAKVPEKPRRSMLVHVLGPDGRPMAGVKSIDRSGPASRSRMRNRSLVSDGRGPVASICRKAFISSASGASQRACATLRGLGRGGETRDVVAGGNSRFGSGPGRRSAEWSVTARGQPIKGVVVEVKLERGGRGEGRTDARRVAGRTGSDHHQGTAPVTDEQGRWTLDNVPPGDDLELRLKLSHPDYISDPEWGTMQDQQGIDLKSLRARTAAITMRGGIVATGTVTDPARQTGRRRGRCAGRSSVLGGRQSGGPHRRTGPVPPAAAPLGENHGDNDRPGLDARSGQGRRPTGDGPRQLSTATGQETCRIRVVDQAGKPIEGVGVMIDKWRGGESLYNHKHPNVLDTQIPVQTDGSGLYHWTWSPDDQVTYRFDKEGYVQH